MDGTCTLQVALPPAGPEAEVGTAELHVQTCPEAALLAPDGPLLPPALWCPQTAQPGGMEAREQGKCAQAADLARPPAAKETVVRLEVMAIGAEPSGRITLKGDTVERAGLVGGLVGGRKVTEGSLFTTCFLPAFAPFGDCAFGGNPYWAFRK